MCSTNAIREAYSDLTPQQIEAFNGNLHIIIYRENTARVMIEELGTLARMPGALIQVKPKC